MCLCYSVALSPSLRGERSLMENTLSCCGLLMLVVHVMCFIVRALLHMDFSHFCELIITKDGQSCDAVIDLDSYATNCVW